VTPCHDSRDDYQRYVYKEYLAYKAYQLFTPAAFRVRLVEITYEDLNDNYDTRTKIGFLIEDDENMAERNGAVHMDFDDFSTGQFHPGRVVGKGGFNRSSQHRRFELMSEAHSVLWLESSNRGSYEV
jgi:hypothetical protein